MQFTRLRLSGFKSFVDATELVIEPGLTGVVGPNGCGKSNLVEALKWVMGETSARQMRGGEMEDVIFGGTASRPPRNVAEVLLHLDNGSRTAPAQFNEHDDLEIARRIERERGSTYKVNGREVRARDVQLLFADQATGARSTALVSQGRIGALISAKPTQRRMLLEEAAGITGLHSRRHEAELRLRGAEANLARLDDVLATMETQMNGLRKQARQATRYRNLSDHIRTAEAALYARRWEGALDALDAARTAHAAAEERVEELTKIAALLSRRQAEAASGLPALREAEATAAARLQHLRLTGEQLAAEEARLAEAVGEHQSRLAQIDGDLERERRLLSEADQFMARLEAERAEIAAARSGEALAIEAAAEALARAGLAVAGLEAELATLTEAVAHDEAQRGALDRRLSEIAARRARLGGQRDQAAAERATLAAQGLDEAALADGERAVETAEGALEAARARLDGAEAARARLDEATAAAVNDARTMEAASARLEAEEQALARLLEAGDAGVWPPVLDALTVEPGYEAALGAALGEDLTKPLDTAAPAHWRALGPLAEAPALPEGASALSRFVRGPEALARRLSQVGVVDDDEAGARLMARLRQGQRLVSRDGGCWRWDGFMVAAGTPTAEAIRLEQRNRLAGVRAELTGARAAAERAASALETARAAAAAALEAERTARDEVRRFDRELVGARAALADIRDRAARHASKVAVLDETLSRLALDIDESASQEAEAKTALARLPDLGTARERVAGLRARLAEERTAQVERKSAHDRALNEAEARSRRLAAIAHELESWEGRKVSAVRQIETLDQRRAETAEVLADLAARPEEIERKRLALLEAVAEAEAARARAADALAVAETAAREADAHARDADATLAAAREHRVRAEAQVEQGRAACRDIAERVDERLECRPEDLRALAGLEADAELPALDKMEDRLDRLLKERETMGPVNLRAEHEAAELTERMQTMEQEKSDLIRAIDKLRRGIAELNREGRERLLSSFAEVDRHFQDLFTRLFGGGRAHLELTESDDPLEAGLEIMASPPGKRLQILSLLSGGEQALTALALLFAVFLTNPAPICVLDEVDAPLDDANVDRFCTLLNEIAAMGSTRFLVITHHRMTMARMDRLFGVTMSERGVSQLVSVDLGQAEDLRATA